MAWVPRREELAGTVPWQPPRPPGGVHLSTEGNVREKGGAAVYDRPAECKFFVSAMT